MIWGVTVCNFCVAKNRTSTMGVDFCMRYHWVECSRSSWGKSLLSHDTELHDLINEELPGSFSSYNFKINFTDIAIWRFFLLSIGE